MMINATIALFFLLLLGLISGCVDDENKDSQGIDKKNPQTLNALVVDTRIGWLILMRSMVL